jgi:CO dehydrogenase/acetyl-CoA synthase alpha subunit
MSFFEENFERLATDIKRREAKDQIHNEIAKVITTLLESANQAVVIASRKVAEAQVELMEAQSAFKALEKSKHCVHEFEPSNENCETCKHCNWVHYC